MTDEQKKNNVIELPLDFTVIDLETTGLDFWFDDIIELAAVRYRNGKRQESISYLANPGRLIPTFIEELTGITNDMLKDAPPYSEVIGPFSEFLQDDILVGHNIPFDINFLLHHGYEVKGKYINTIRIANKALPDLSHRRLPDLAKELQIPVDIAHRAEADCVTTGECYLKMREKVLASMSEAEFTELFTRNHNGSYADYNAFIKGLSVDATDFPETDILGKTVVFTGAMERMKRKEALEIVARLGGTPADSVTKKTNILVVGNKDFVASVRDGKTGKMKKAEEYARQGFDIITISENTFIEMVDTQL